ncbi:threonine dehydratase [Ketogulonicigenium robustum]|uniref:L-threonine dehydratase n=1 Tax=Ketogulonicigenium robustum TaxID=92947 RepID=A0A1W6P2E0_9RHOB|nr:threonine ammonia-lyase IlvA [Ketogulonicigenium robustum]ARO15678.1 threonine dehydratase [Ketogulonicigenium robustum]
MSTFVENARAATAALRDLFPETPLQRNDFLSQRYDADIWLKREDLTPVRSYKIRGAFTAMRMVLARTPEQSHFVCASAGNHAQGLAFACKHFGVKGTIFMPVTTPQQKIEKTRAFGGDNVQIRLIGDYFDQSLAAAQKFCADEDAYFLAPYDDIDVILGQSTVAAEVVDQLGRAPDVMLVPVGGGGLAAGTTSYMRAMKADTSFRFVEPTGAASLTAAVAEHGPVTLNKVDGFVDGAAVARIGRHNFDALDWVSAGSVLRVPEDRLCATMVEVLNIEGIVLEPAGALSIDALQDVADQIRGKTVVCVISGGNFDFERLPEVKERAQRYRGLKKYFILRLPQRPGALRDFLMMLGPDDDVSRFEYLKKNARNFGTILLGLETTKRENFDILLKRMTEGGFGYQDITENEMLTSFLL